MSVGLRGIEPVKFATEAELVAAFCARVDREYNQNPNRRGNKWTAYHETAGWDLLLVNEIGVQVGIEAKLVLNAKVLEQSLPGHGYWRDSKGPDYRAVLVPRYGLQHHLGVIAGHLGITVIALTQWGLTHLPDEQHPGFDLNGWHNWLPAERCQLPEYVPDVVGGHSSPVTLSAWKISAIKLLIMLDRFGSVTRKDMRALKLSESRWTAAYGGFLQRGDGGYVRGPYTPDLKALHPVNWAQIEADFDKWIKPVRLEAALPLAG